MHTPYIKRTINKQARNQRFEHASKTKTHKSKTNRKTNKQETHGILHRNLFRFFVRKAMQFGNPKKQTKIAKSKSV